MSRVQVPSAALLNVINSKKSASLKLSPINSFIYKELINKRLIKFRFKLK